MVSKEKVTYILDTSSVLSGKTFVFSENSIVTTPGVSDEISQGGKDYQKFELLKEIGLKIIYPTENSIEDIRKTSKKTGDIGRLSETDIEVLALSLDLKKEGKKTILLTDDYSMQNVSESLGIKYQNISQSKITKRYKWISKCTGCKKKFKEHINICPICGSGTKKTISIKSDIKTKK